MIWIGLSIVVFGIVMFIVTNIKNDNYENAKQQQRKFECEKEYGPSKYDDWW